MSPKQRLARMSMVSAAFRACSRPLARRRVGLGSRQGGRRLPGVARDLKTPTTSGEGVAVTKSLPGGQHLHSGASSVRIGLASRVQNAVTTAGVKVMPWIPVRARRLLTGGRSVVIDGNTLDTTLQAMLTGMRAVGIDGLVVDDDPAASRAMMAKTMKEMPGPQIHVEVREISIPGPAGEIRARHYVPPGDGPAPLLVFYHGGGWAIGDLDTHDAPCRLTCRDAGVHVVSIDYRLAPEHPAPLRSRMRMPPSRGPTSMPRSWGGPGASSGRRRQRRRQPRRGGEPAGARQRRPNPGTAVAALPAHRLQREKPVAESVRAWLPADQT